MFSGISLCRASWQSLNSAPLRPLHRLGGGGEEIPAGSLMSGVRAIIGSSSTRRTSFFKDILPKREDC